MNTFTKKFENAKQNGFNIGSCVRVQCEDKFLLIKRADSDFGAGIFELPGGTVDDGESLEKAAARELFEESGIVVNERNLVPLDTFEFHNIETKKHKVKFAFSFVLQSLPQITLSSEHSEYAWLTKDEIQNLPRQGVDEDYLLWADHYDILMINI